jgi:predicted CXXCH cytochrome family protein
MLLLALLFVLLTVLAVYTLTEGPHSFTEVQCYKCHRDPQGNPKLLVGRPITELCRPCHAKTIKTSSHPVDVLPVKARVPADLPLRDGMITCNTCHDIHSDSTIVFGQKSYFLRRPTADFKFFCISCHEENTLAPGHAELLTVAHLGSKYRVSNPFEPIDSLSQLCIGCHDGSMGQDVAVNIGTGQWSHMSGDSHPIGVDYKAASARNSGLASAALLDRRIRFIGGRIGCGTCHDAYSPLPAKLVMDNHDSKLCMQCHFDK